MVEFGQFINFDSIDSTNRYCEELLAKSNPLPFTVISADYQTRGSGQIGSKWISDRGQNALMSVIVYPGFINVSESFKLHYMAALACVETLACYLDESRITVKWPNDILIDKKKTAGILIKNTFTGSAIRHSILGFGVNVNQADFDALPGLPITSLAQATGHRNDIPAFRKLLYEKFREMYRLTEEGPGLKEVYMMKLYGYDQPFSYYDCSDQRYRRGKIIDVTEDGRLAVKTDGEVCLYGFKEIKFLLNE